MFAKCVSRTFVAVVLASALAVVPAAGVLAAPISPADDPSGWLDSIHRWAEDWTQDVLSTLRLRPQPNGETDDPQVVAAPLPDGEGFRHVTADDNPSFDPDG